MITSRLKARNTLVASCLCAALLSPSAQAFTFLAGTKYAVHEGRMTYSLNLPGTTLRGDSWADAFRQAAREWTMTTPIQIDTHDGNEDPCAPLVYGHPVGFVGWSSTLCGWAERVPSGVKAMAQPNLKTLTEIASGNIFFSSADHQNWDIYKGPMNINPIADHHENLPLYKATDFRRVAVHEIGHTLGLGHSKFPASIMATGLDASADKELPTPDDICGVNILNGRPDACPLLLPHPVSITGQATSAMFVGGASKDQGVTYATLFARDDVIDVMATVVVEDDHMQKTGRLHTVIELSDGTLLMKTDQGFAPWDGSVELLKTTATQTLEGANEIYILRQFDLKANGIANMTVAMYIGYSLDDEPGELYYSGQPIVFQVQ